MDTNIADESQKFFNMLHVNFPTMMLGVDDDSERQIKICSSISKSICRSVLERCPVSFAFAVIRADGYSDRKWRSISFSYSFQSIATFYPAFVSPVVRKRTLCANTRGVGAMTHRVLLLLFYGAL